MLLVATPAFAQGWPDRAITIIVPFASGGPTDRVAQALAGTMTDALGQPVLLRNLGGAGGTVGMADAARAPADGYTLLLGHLSHITAPALQGSLRDDRLGDFAPIGRVADVPMVLLGRTDLDAQTPKDLLAFIRSHRNKVTLAHAERGTESHLCALLLIKATGAAMTTVAYKGIGPAIADLEHRRADLLCDQTTKAPSRIVSGRIRAYAVAAKARLAALKDVPTFAESGLRGVDFAVWHGLYAPKGTPRDVVYRLAAALQASVKNESFAARLAELGATPAKPADATPAALGAWTTSEAARWAPIVRAAGKNAP